MGSRGFFHHISKRTQRDIKYVEEILSRTKLQPNQFLQALDTAVDSRNHKVIKMLYEHNPNGIKYDEYAPIFKSVYLESQLKVLENLLLFPHAEKIFMERDEMADNMLVCQAIVKHAEEMESLDRQRQYLGVFKAHPAFITAIKQCMEDESITPKPEQKEPPKYYTPAPQKPRHNPHEESPSKNTQKTGDQTAGMSNVEPSPQEIAITPEVKPNVPPPGQEEPIDYKTVSLADFIEHMKATGMELSTKDALEMLESMQQQQHSTGENPSEVEPNVPPPGQETPIDYTTITLDEYIEHMKATGVQISSEAAREMLEGLRREALSNQHNLRNDP